MPTYIKKDAIVRLFESNGFKLTNLESGPAFVFRSKSGFSMEFPVKWLDGDPERDYDLAQVRHVLNNMATSSKKEDSIHSFMGNKKKMDELFSAARDYGMSYDQDTNMLICKKTPKSRTAIFTVEVDYIVALKLETCKDMDYKEIFDALKESAELDKQESAKKKVNK